MTRTLRAGIAIVVLGGVALTSVPGMAQVVKQDLATSVLVVKPRGEFATKLNGAKIPRGRGWRAITDAERVLEISLPEKWKVDANAEGGILLRATPPGLDREKTPSAQLMVTFNHPRNADAPSVDEEFATTYADSLAETPELSRFGFKVTDSGYVHYRNYRFALAGGSLTIPKRGVYRQMQLLFIGEDRIVTITFSAPDRDFAKYQDDLLGILASYQTVGKKKPEVDDPPCR